jgi:FMN reductase
VRSVAAVGVVDTQKQRSPSGRAAPALAERAEDRIGSGGWGNDYNAPLVVGIGGTTSARSSTERAMLATLNAAAAAGARVRIFPGLVLSGLPIYQPDCADRTPAARDLVEAVRQAAGVIVATPSYHGGISGAVKNALDYLEDLRADPQPYLDGRAVGCVVTAAGWQAAGPTLSALRSVVHALRGWPTPLGATLNTSQPPFDGPDADPGIIDHLTEVGRQVVTFARQQAAAVNRV